MAEMLRRIWLGLQEHDPGPLVRRVIRIGTVIGLFMLAIALYAPALGDSRFVYGTDTVSHDYIMHYYGWVKSIAGLGELPLWNPYIFSGLPMIGSAALCPFYPSQWLYLLLPFNTAFTLQYILAVALGGIGAAWWMRCLGLRRAICLWAGVLYMVSGHFLTLTYAGHLQKMIALGWAPIALGATYQLVRLGKSGRRTSQLYKTTCALGVALGMQLLASHPQIFYATALACVLQLVGMAITAVPWKALASGKSQGPGLSHEIKPVGRAVLLSALAILVCCVISAAQLFPQWEMAGVSNRAAGVSYTEAVETSYPPLEILEYGLPSVFGSSVIGAPQPYFGKWGERIVSDYLGLPVLFLVILGVFGSRRRYRWFLVILVAAGLLIGLGRYLPLYWLLYHVLPGFNGFRSPGTFMFLANCGMIGLAAFGMDYLVSLAQSVNARGWKSSLEVNEPTAAAANGALPPKSAPRRDADAGDTQPFEVASLYAKNPRYTEGTDTPPQNPSIEYDEEYEDPGYGYTVSSGQGYVSSSNFMWDAENIPWLGRPAMLLFLAALAVTALVAAIIALGENWGVNLKTATEAERMNFHMYSLVASSAIAIMLLLGGILLLRLRTWIGALAIGATALAFPLIYNYAYLRFEPLSPYMAHLTKQPELLRLAKTAPQPVRLIEQNALKNEDMLHGVGSAAGYHPIMLESYAEAMAALGMDSDGFAQLFTVNYARTSDENPPAGGHWALNEELSGRGNTAARIWTRTHPAPYLHNQAELVVVDTEELSLTSSSLRAIAMADVGDGAAGAQGELPDYTARIDGDDADHFHLYEGLQMAEAQLQRWTPHEIRLHVRAAAPRKGEMALLSLSEPLAPGWIAETSKGARLPIIGVNGVQRGVVLPPGSYNVRLVYKPFSLRLGLFISLISGTVLVGFGMASLTRRFTKGKKKVKKALKKAQTGKHPTIEGTA